MDVENPTGAADPKCANCGHLWSRHYVNDPDPRCSLDTSDPYKEKWCTCGGFQLGCANCGHRMLSHGGLGLEQCYERIGYDHYGHGSGPCGCQAYEDST